MSEANPAATVPPSGRPTLGRGCRLSYDRARERHVLLTPETVVVLNGSGADILELCDGQRTVADIVAQLRPRYDQVVDDEVPQFLARLVARRSVVIDDG